MCMHAAQMRHSDALHGVAHLDVGGVGGLGQNGGAVLQAPAHDHQQLMLAILPGHLPYDGVLGGRLGAPYDCLSSNSDDLKPLHRHDCLSSNGFVTTCLKPHLQALTFPVHPQLHTTRVVLRRGGGGGR